MNKATSIYLDAMRFLAALLVFFNHAQLPRLHGEWLTPLGAFGRDAVLIFFVLSGYVIAHAVGRKGTTARVYTVDRMARLWSVVLPALVLTVLLDYSGKLIKPEMYAGGVFEDSYPVIRFLANLLFVNELWFESIRPFSNGPFWSLGYEAPYYLLFGLWIFCKGPLRWLAILATGAVIGPKVLLLFPVWVFGVAAYRLSGRSSHLHWLGMLLFFGSLAGYAVFFYFDMSKWLLDLSVEWLGWDFVMRDLKYSKFFVASYCIGLFVALNFIGFNALPPSMHAAITRFEVPIRFAAAYTFSLYLFHYPLLHFFGALFDRSLVIVTCSLAAVFVLGTFTEQRKDVFRRVINEAMSWCDKRIHRRGLEL
jgi:peptidoglycan/LPS O-acetylase OafA/YrhL